MQKESTRHVNLRMSAGIFRFLQVIANLTVIYLMYRSFDSYRDFFPEKDSPEYYSMFLRLILAEKHLLALVIVFLLMVYVTFCSIKKLIRDNKNGAVIILEYSSE